MHGGSASPSPSTSCWTRGTGAAHTSRSSTRSSTTSRRHTTPCSRGCWCAPCSGCACRRPLSSWCRTASAGLSSWVRTAYGVSVPFDVHRSLRQGDPLAPLLFVVLLDALHDGLERNPFTGEEHGLAVRVLEPRAPVTATLPSLGYADDTAVLANSLPSLRIQNDWVHYFMASTTAPQPRQVRARRARRMATARQMQQSPLLASPSGATIEPVPHDQHPLPGRALLLRRQLGPSAAARSA